MANVQIYQLDNAGSDLDNSALLAMDIPNPDTSAASEVPYVTRKESIASLETQMLQTDEYTTELDTTRKTIIGAINENKSVIGYSYDAYDDTSTYAVGDLCIYNNTLYKAKQATTGNLPTNTTYWEQTSIANAINELKDDITTANYWKTTQLTIANGVSVNAGVETQPVTISVPQYTGYTVLTFTEVRATGYHGAKVIVQAELANANELVYALYNPSNVNATVTVTVRVIYVKTIT